MNGFIEKLRLRERAEEDIYFARLDRELIAALHRNDPMRDPSADRQSPEPHEHEQTA